MVGVLGEAEWRLLGRIAPERTFVHFTPSGQLPP
jgi:hypothetical protein